MAVELKNCNNTVVHIQYIQDTPPKSGFSYIWCFRTPQTERLSAFVTVLEVCGNVKGFFTGRPRGAASQARPAAESSPLVVLCIMKRDA